MFGRAAGTGRSQSSWMACGLGSLLIVLFAGGCGDSAGGVGAESEPVSISVVITDGEIDDASRRRVAYQTPVTITVTADVSDEVHVHGYDLLAPVAVGTIARFEFVANRSGVWEIELEEQGRTLFELQVDR